MKQTKRKRGGQKGNQNARTHGFYSSLLTSDQMSQLWTIVTKENVPPESAIMRLKLQSMLSQSTANTRTLKEAVRLLVKWSAQKYHLNRVGRVHMRALIESAFPGLFRDSVVQTRKNSSKPSLIWKMINEIGHAQISENLVKKPNQARISFK